MPERSETRNPPICRPWPAVGALLLAFAVAVAGASPVLAAGMLVADGDFGGVLEVVDHDVRVVVNNGIAVTEVTQVFRNTENRAVEALYTFPVPEGASVANFSMWINGKEMVGEVLEKQRAREIYDSYKRQKRDPGLLEQADYKTFEMRVFPIAAKAEQRVQIAYYQELAFDNDWATWVYPLATVAHDGRGSRTTGRFSLDLQVKSEVPIVELESPSHAGELVVVGHTPGFWQASLEVQGGDLNRDVVLAYRASRPRTGLDLVASHDGRDDGYFLLTLTTGGELDGLVGGMDYVFILDLSGSMNSDGKLAISRESLAAFVNELGDGDQFEIISFNASSRPLFRALRPVDEGARTAAFDFLASQEARGGTFLEPAIRAAYRYKSLDRTLNVVVLSDGITEQRERRTLLRLMDERPDECRVFAIGIGNEVDRPLLEQLAEDAGGLAAFVSRGDSFERQARAFRRKLMRPVATNVEIELAGGGVYDLEPERLPNLYHGMPLRLYGRYRQPGPVAVRLRATVGGELLDRSVEIELPDREENPELERMWAWHRVRRLLKEADRDGSRDGVIDEIVRLGEAYSIVTEHTSFIVLENDNEYRRWQIERRNALRLERDRRAQERVRRRLEDLRNGVAEDLGPVDPDKKPAPAAQSPVQPEPGRQVARQPPLQQQPQESRRKRNVDLDFGGGAFDPVSGLLAVGLGALGFLKRRKRNA